jgi:glycosyltransferase involved in cell wall biosynthesis
MTKRAIRVMLIAPLPPPVGGIATWTTRILRVPDDDDIERIHVDTSVGAGYVARLTWRKAFKQLFVAGRVFWKILTVRPDVIHVTTSYDRGWRRDTLFLAVARSFGAKTLLNFRGGDFSRMYDEATNAAQKKMRHQLVGYDAIVAITIESEHFLKNLDLTNVRVIPNCIDVTQAPPRRRRNGPTRWLFVGNVIKAKGIVELLSALRHFPNAHLTLVGPAPTGIPGDGMELMTQAVADPTLAGRITHTDQMPPELVRAIYPNHDIFVFPTRREGFPNAVLEAMEAGLPIVATKVGAIPDMIVDGEHGLLADCGDQDGLERSIATITTNVDLAERMGRAARARVESEYEIAHVASMWYRLYRQLAVTAGPAQAD